MGALGRSQLPVVLLSLQELTQGMADNLIAARFETDTGLQCIEVAVECVA